MKQISRLRTFLKILAGCSVIVFSVYTFSWINKPTYGFAMYYTYSRMVFESEDLTKIYDFDYFNSKVREYGINTIDMPNNPPTAALPMLPIVGLSATTAKILWSLLSVVLFIWSLKILFALYSISPLGNLGLGLIALSFLFRPAYDGIALGQMYFVILFLFSLSLRSLSKNQKLAPAAPLGLALVIKGYGIVPLLWLAYQKYWKTVLAALVVIVGIIALTLPLLHVEMWKIFFQTVLPSLGTRPADGHVAYQTINGFLSHLFLYDSQWLEYPIVQLPGNVLRGFSYVLNLLLIFFVFRGTRTSNKNDLLLSYSAAIATGVLTAPLAEEYHFVLFLPLIIGMAARFIADRPHGFPSNTFEVLFVLGTLLLALPIKYKDLANASFPIILFAYPKLYGGLILLYTYKRFESKFDYSDADPPLSPVLA